MIIYPVKCKFKGIFVSVWFDKKFSFYCKKRPKMEFKESPEYYIPLVFTEYKTKEEIESYIKEKILDRYGVELAKWRQSIHVKYFYEVEDASKQGVMEVWTEHNYDGNIQKWIDVCNWNSYKPFKGYEVSSGFEMYKYFPFRLVGSLFTLRFIILKSDYKYQYLLIRELNGDDE